MKKRIEFEVKATQYGVSHVWGSNLEHTIKVNSYRFWPDLLPFKLGWRQHFLTNKKVEVSVSEFHTLPTRIKQMVIVLA